MNAAKSFFTHFLVTMLAVSGTNIVHAASVVSSSQAVQSLILQLIASTDTQAHLLLDARESLHRINLSVAKLKLLQEAELVVVIGSGEPDFLHEQELSELRKSDEGNVFLVKELPEDALFARGCNDHDDRHDEHLNSSCADPHIWLSIDNARLIAKLLAGRLSEVDVANAGQYAKNLTAVHKNLDELHANIKQILATRDENMKVVVWHDAYRYFQISFELADYHSITDGDGHSGLSGKKLLLALESLNSSDNSCLLFDSSFDMQQHKSAFDSVENLKIAIADPIGYNNEINASSYAKLLGDIATAFASCR